MNDQMRGTDTRVIVSSRENVIFQFLYLPTGNKRLWAEIILRDVSFGFECLAEYHPGRFGGDLNHLMEHTVAEEREPRLIILDVSKRHKLEDGDTYERSKPTLPTNKFRSCRRIDRFYDHISWKGMKLSYHVTKPPVITSTHYLIAIESRTDSTKDLQMCKKRFKLPLIRFSLSISNFRRMPIDLDFTIDEAMFGIEYSCRDFFQARRVESTIFTCLTNAPSSQEADSTLGMLTLTTDYYRKLYRKTPTVSEQTIQEFLDPVRSRLSVAERMELDKPFVADDLYSALKTANMATSPGPDGIQFPILEQYWEKIGPILTNSAKK